LERYQGEETSGRSYDRAVENRFELAIFRLERTLLQDLFRRLFHSRPDTRYLDFACGTGRILCVFRDRVRHRTGIDTSSGQLQAARQKDPDAVFIRGNVVTEPALLAGREFDLITCFRLLLNLESENRLPILRVLRQLLAPDGYLIVNNHMNRYSVLGLMALFAHKVLRVPRKPRVPPGKRGISSTMSDREIRGALEAAGLEVKEVFRMAVLPGHGSHMALPESWLVPIETILSRTPLVNRLGKNQIFVCRRAPHSPA
jgi:2-polyprenyl-3-methyl-5-hydroxy-6-metoxy-1,4-benzoquinol methylase